MGKLDALAALVGNSGIPANPVAVAAPKAEELVSAPVLKSKEDRFKALKAVEASLNKQFKTTTSIVRLGSKVGQVMPSMGGNLPTLDYGVIGTGGLPRGRIIELFGEESSGKCLPGDTYIRTEKGLHTVEEVFRQNGLNPSNKTRTTPKTFKLVDRHGNLESTSEFTHNGSKHLKRINTFSGSYVESTFNHPHLVMNERGSWVWKTTQQIAPGDFLIQRREYPSGTVSESWDVSYMVGVVLADGHIEAHRINITNDDPCLKNFILNIGYEILGKEPRTYDNNGKGSVEFHFSSKDGIGEFLSRTGLVPGNSSVKEFGPKVRSYDKNSLRPVIQGYMDCEMSIDASKRTIEVISASHKLLFELKMLLMNFGIVSLLRGKVVSAYPDNNYYRLTVGGEDAIKYYELIGTSSLARAISFQALLHRSGSTNFDSIPNSLGILRDLYDASETGRGQTALVGDILYGRCNLTYSKLDEILKWRGWNECSALDRLREIQSAQFFYDRVVSVEDKDPRPTFDFHLPCTHSFIANGFITHNTTLALHYVAHEQARGGICSYIDAEHALDPTYMAALGVNVDELMASQPDSLEQAIETADALVDSGAITLIVVDSVASLTPQAELNGESGDVFMGLQARLMGQAMRKLRGKCAINSVTILFINQLRTSLGVTYGDPSVTPGGKALKFYASVRLKVGKVGGDDGKIKSGGVDIGHKVRVRAVKNKVGCPAQTTEIELVYGVGFDTKADAIEHGIKVGAIQQSGAWFTLGEHRAQGKAQLKSLLKDNQDAMELLKTEIDKAHAAQKEADQAK